LEQDEKVDEAVFAAKRATRKVDEIADKLEKHNKRIDIRPELFLADSVPKTFLN
jgi:hypothetical protein